MSLYLPGHLHGGLALPPVGVCPGVRVTVVIHLVGQHGIQHPRVLQETQIQLTVIISWKVAGTRSVHLLYYGKCKWLLSVGHRLNHHDVTSFTIDSDLTDIYLHENV